MADYSCPHCGWGQQRALGRSENVDVVIVDGQVALVDAEDWEADAECLECGRFYHISSYGPVEQFARDVERGQQVSQKSMKREINI